MIPARGGRQVKAKRFADDAQDISDSLGAASGAAHIAGDPAAAGPYRLRLKRKAAAADTYRQLNLFGDVFERVAPTTSKPEDTKLIESAINGMLPGSTRIRAIWSRRRSTCRCRPAASSAGSASKSPWKGLIKGVADRRHPHQAGVMANDIITKLDEEQVGPHPEPGCREDARPGEHQDRSPSCAGPGQADRVSLTRDVIRGGRAFAAGGRCRLTSASPSSTSRPLKPEEAITDLQNQIPAEKLKGFVVDLRNNPGGLLDQAISVSDAFLSEARSSPPAAATPKRPALQRPCRRPHQGKPVIVLINGGSASA